MAKSPEVFPTEMKTSLEKRVLGVTYLALDPMLCSFALDSHQLWLF